MSEAKKRVMIFGFGGTLAMVQGPHGLEPAKSVSEILDMVPSLRDMADLEFEEIENRDSTDINPQHWTKLAFRLREVQAEYDAVIVTHGTDTMAYTASGVALALGRGLGIPVVFTGSQLPLASYGSDATFNMENALKVVLQASEAGIAEVMIVFNARVLRACRSIKTSEADFDAFDSPAFHNLARLTALDDIRFIPEAFRVGDSQEAAFEPHFQRGILTVDLVPGLEPGILIETLRSGKVQGLLLKSLGAGNVPWRDEYSLIPVIETAVHELKIPVVVATKFVGGRTEMNLYEGGQKALEAGAIPAGDMTDVMAQVKLMWALAQGSRDRDELMTLINTDFIGEITA